MLRKTTAAVVLAGALALGTASATSLGNFNSPTFAASGATLLDCEITNVTDLVSLLPETQTVGEPLTGSGATLDLATLDITSLTSDLATKDVACVSDTLLDLVLIDGNGDVLDTVSGIDIDPDTATGLDAVSVADGIDIVNVAEIRAVLRDA